MPDVPEKTVTIDSDHSIIVISDLHFGGSKGSATSNRFQKFLNRINGMYSPVLSNQLVLQDFTELRNDLTGKLLKSPAMIILLGDIIDLWVHRGELRTQTFRDSYLVFLDLYHLPCRHLVYVMGNHDTEIREIATTDFRAMKDKTITIAKDMFPEDEGTCLRCGKYCYRFLHGHQLDPAFVRTGLFSEYPGWIANNESIFSSHPCLKIFPWTIIFLAVVYAIASFFVSMAFIPPVAFLVFLFLAGMSIPLVAVSVPVRWLDWLFNIYARSPFHSLVQKIVGKKLPDPKFMTVRCQVANKSLFPNLTSGQVNTVVLGHTHVPDDYLAEDNVRYLNSGSWVIDNVDDLPYDSRIRYFIPGIDRKEDFTKEFSRRTAPDTFIYIDEEGPLLLSYNQNNAYRVLVQYPGAP